jgi:FlaA1/EpsC-like NDP-sugar epimerase
VQLVLQAAALGNQGEVFVLDMGEPVRVRDLAMDLIELSGLEAGVDIEVRYTGIRPGEKLFEELFFKGDHVTPTIHPKILRARDAESSNLCADDIGELIHAAQANRPAFEIRQLISKLVPEFTGQFVGTVSEESKLSANGAVLPIAPRLEVSTSKTRPEGEPWVASAGVKRS